MKPFASHIVALLVLLSLQACDHAPPNDYQDHHGNRGRFAALQGKWLVINYWATWCKPCAEEIPELNQFAASQSHRAVVFGVDFDRHQGQELQQAIDKLGIEFPVLVTEPAAQLGAQRPSVLPTTLIINPQGQLHRTLHGPQTLQTLTDALDAQEEAK